MERSTGTDINGPSESRVIFASVFAFAISFWVVDVFGLWGVKLVYYMIGA